MSATTRSPRSDSWWRTAPVLTIAVLALIVSTAGGAYAVGKNSIGTKQLKNNAVTSGKIRSSTIQSSDVKNNSLTSSDVRNGSLTRGDFAAGQLPSVPAAPSRTYFARISADGTIEAKSPGVVTAIRDGVGQYTVVLSFDPARCGLVSTSVSSSINTSADVLNTRSVYVFARLIDGGETADSPLTLSIMC
ncbi:MAG: hypothetical protein ABWX74_15565 [Aeromicrobium sp.]